MSTTKRTVLVTGISGFIASHVVLELLKKGYSVRGTVRASRMESIRATVCKKYPNLEVIPIEDVTKDDLSNALKGVDAVIHVPPMMPPTEENPDETIKSIKEATLNVLRQANKVGVNKVVITSSWAATVNPVADVSKAFTDITFTGADWGIVDETATFKTGEANPMVAYFASKVMEEKAAWDYAEKHPEIDLSTVIPTFVFGPFAPDFPPRSKEYLGSNTHVFGLLSSGGDLPMQMPPMFCDVRDVAKAHVAALLVDKKPGKRYLVNGGAFTWKEAVEHLTQAMPEIKPRLASTEKATPLPPTLCKIEVGPAEKDLGIKEWVGWRKTVEDTIKSLVEEEKKWQ
ncbi:NAD(P)-binding protein [Dendrothele bispora CBS 962.96]|uniref:NAD(P)-binding protein n=1 Tax=Dendrothele bispora (strain CBS 962.96) TaxID=1314807 RepID=A0A4S8M6F8_DENBC|nr:NAD(P)-binding protein [Dendrothele bispora CBS 962.96]